MRPIWNSDSGALSHPSLYLNVSLRSRYGLGDEMKCKIWQWQEMVSTEMRLRGNLKQRSLKTLSPRLLLTVFHLKIKADSGEKGERREGFGKQVCSFGKAVGGQTGCNIWRSAMWLSTHMSLEMVSSGRVVMKTNTKAWALHRPRERDFVRFPFHHPSPQQS